MYTVIGDFEPADGHTDLSFSDLAPWSQATVGRVAGSTVYSAGIVLGDEERGPVVLCIALPPDLRPPDAPAHQHASDNWRISLKGELPVGRETYGAGEFRLQAGWKPYAKDNYAAGPEGGWMVLAFADRRGTRVRKVKDPEPVPSPTDLFLADYLGISGDLLSDDPADGPGPSAFVTDIGPVKAFHSNASFADADAWPERDGCRVGVALQGDQECGPVLAFVAAGPGVVVEEPTVVDTEVLRVVSGGSCRIGDRNYRTGDLRVQAAGAPLEPLVAGPEGVHLSVIVADRRGLPAGDAHGWLGELPDAVRALRADLTAGSAAS